MTKFVGKRDWIDNFEIFLGLILKIKSVTGIEQIIWFSKEQFVEFLSSEDNSVFPEQQEVLNVISEELGIIPFESPYEYVKRLQAEFDYSELRFTEEYYDALGICRE